MKNFPSSLIRQQSTKNGLGNNVGDTLKNIGTKTLSNLFSNGKSASDTKDMKNKFERGYTRPELPQMLEEVNIFSETSEIKKMTEEYNQTVDFQYNYQNGKENLENIVFEDPFKFSSSIFSVINNYKYVFNYTVPSISKLAATNEKGDYVMAMPHSIVSPSLFNPYVGINVTGITENIPLVNKDPKTINGSVPITSGLDDADTTLNKGVKMKFESSLYGNGHQPDISDCSIRTLVKLSQEHKLGSETYRYQDFMYCKDLGKIPNNRLITLRRFPAPVGDNIYDDNICGITDIGRLITWFDNEDNKLENICKYNYHATWEKFTAELKYEDSQDKDEGIIGNLANFLSPENNKLVGQGFSPNYGLLQGLASSLNIPLIGNPKTQYYNTQTLTNYDQHKIYEPANRISSMFKYNGDLQFNQEITLVFRYVLRSYDNINPRAAMMDLLGNIMTVTYTRGKFWGGENHIIGGANRSVYETADKLINKGFDFLGGIWKALESGNFNIDSLKSWLSNMLDQGKVLLNQAKTKSKEIVGEGNTEDKVKHTTTTVAQQISKADKKYGWSNALKGMLKNQLGRPAIYAFNSLLTGEDNGLWHLTIGNPRNPIMSIGNLIIDDDVSIQHYGPLGIDDFPTEMSVTITLKHQRPRDRIDIEKMYTKGRSAIYQPMNLIDIKKYYSTESFGDLITLKNPDKTLRINLGNI